MLRSALLLLVLATGCQSDPAPTRGVPAQRPDAVVRWRSAPADGVEFAPGEPLVVRTTPHTVLWQEGSDVLRPPYTVRAALHKRSGRLHEGFGLVFGGQGLDRAEQEQRYSYFLVRGDGSFLVKRRDGAAAPVVVPWTASPAIRREGSGTGQANELAVEVGPEEVVFRVNGTEVGRVPASELHTAGIAGLRVSHGVELEVREWGVSRPEAERRG